MKNLTEYITNESLLDDEEDLLNNTETSKIISSLSIVDDSYNRRLRVKSSFGKNEYKDCMGQKLNIGDIVITSFTVNSWTGTHGFRAGVVVELSEDDRGYTIINCAEAKGWVKDKNSYDFWADCNEVMKITPTQAKKLYK